MRRLPWGPFRPPARQRGKGNLCLKLGLPDSIIQSAKAQINQDKTNFEDLLTDLEHNRVTIENERLEIASYKNEIKQLKEKLQKKEDKIQETKDRILREANEKARDILLDAKNVADETIRVFQKAGPGASMRDLEKTREKVRGKISEKNDR